MKFEHDYLDELAKLMNENDLSEIALEDGGKKIILKRERVSQVISQDVTQIIKKEETENVEELSAVNRVPITSPMVGTFYASPSPDKEPYVKKGDFVKAGQTICIIEAMKLLNEIESEVSGKVVEICVENGQTIEFGQTLMYIE